MTLSGVFCQASFSRLVAFCFSRLTPPRTDKAPLPRLTLVRFLAFPCAPPFFRAQLAVPGCLVSNDADSYHSPSPPVTVDFSFLRPHSPPLSCCVYSMSGRCRRSGLSSFFFYARLSSPSAAILFFLVGHLFSEPCDGAFKALNCYSAEPREGGPVVCGRNFPPRSYRGPPTRELPKIFPPLRQVPVPVPAVRRRFTCFHFYHDLQGLPVLGGSYLLGCEPCWFSLGF